MPASLEKLTLESLKSSKLTPTKYVGAQTRTIFNRLSHLFFGSPDKVNPALEAVLCEKHKFIDFCHVLKKILQKYILSNIDEQQKDTQTQIDRLKIN